MSGTVEVPERILSVAPRYRADLTPLQNGHFTVYHDDLRAAAEQVGSTLHILAGDGGPATPWCQPCLPRSDPVALAAAVAAQVRGGDVVMFYEGSLALLEAFIPIARAHPRTTFIVNLFRPEEGIDGPSDLAALRVDDGLPVRAPSREAVGTSFPGNLRITAETPERALLARAAGLPVRAAWALHSTVATVPPVDVARGEMGADELRVLVPLRAGGFDPPPVADVAYVLRRLEQEAGPGRIRFAVTRQGTGRLAAKVRGDRLTRLGAAMIAPGADSVSYAAVIATHDAVWLTGADAPSGFSYRTQSSGKTLDALVAGVPVVGVAGTSPAREPLRWTGLPLGYRTREEAVAVFLRLLEDHGAASQRLRAQRAVLRATYAPEVTIRRVLAVAAMTTDPWGAPVLDRPPDLSPDAGGVEAVVTPLRPALRVLTSKVAARRVTYIPVSHRVWWAARGRLGRLKAAFLSWRRPARPSSL